jgi:hypothetical protein
LKGGGLIGKHPAARGPRVGRVAAQVTLGPPAASRGGDADLLTPGDACQAEPPLTLRPRRVRKRRLSSANEGPAAQPLHLFRAPQMAD